MRIARVVFPIALDKEFDYFIPNGISVAIGGRVLVEFGCRRKIALVIGIEAVSAVEKIKPIIKALDIDSVLTREQIAWAQELAKLYPCALGRLLFMMVPEYLKKDIRLNELPVPVNILPRQNRETIVVAETFVLRYRQWIESVREALGKGSVIICFPQIVHAVAGWEILRKDFLGAILMHSRLSPKIIYRAWQKSRSGKTIIIGTRSALFSCPLDLRLAIIENETDRSYFQDETPYYYLPDLARILAKVTGVDLIFSSCLPSLASFQRIISKKADLIDNQNRLPSIQVITFGETKGIICLSAQELIRSQAQRKKKILIILGNGAGRVESALARILPGLKIDRWNRRSSTSAITVATTEVLQAAYSPPEFDLGLVLDADSFIDDNRYDSAFEGFVFFKQAANLCREKLYLFARESDNRFYGMLNRGWQDFYEHELNTRRDLKLPPFGLLITFALRGSNENKVLQIAQDLYNVLQALEINVFGPFQEYPFKARNNYRYNVLAKCPDTPSARRIVKEQVQLLQKKHIKIAAIVR